MTVMDMHHDKSVYIPRHRQHVFPRIKTASTVRILPQQQRVFPMLCARPSPRACVMISMRRGAGGALAGGSNNCGIYHSTFSLPSQVSVPCLSSERCWAANIQRRAVWMEEGRGAEAWDLSAWLLKAQYGCLAPA
jgi:hypothetical protein